MTQISISDLSQIVSELIDLDLEQQSSIVTAIDRALDARQIVGGKSLPKPIVAGGIRPAPQPNCNVPILINGTIAVSPNCHPPSNFPIGKIAAPGLPHRGKNS